jgi:two-component system response regulator HydG
MDGLALLAASRKLAPARPVIVMTAFSALETAIESIRQGAYHYLTKPFKVDELALFLGRALDESALRREAAALEKTLKERFGLSNMIGTSAAMRATHEIIERVAAVDAPVLVTGETGTGKNLVVRAIHALGPRARGPFVAVNCAALPEALLESELFGHVRGAFTGATSNREGLLEEASGGTLLLDEIGEMSAAMQAKLLHVLESGTVRAVGADKERAIDVRFVTATHRDLRAHGHAGRAPFREDLLYRLDVVSIELVPLRHRREDVVPLLEHFLRLSRSKHPDAKVTSFSKDALARLVEHDWPGNVRELEHLVERAVVLSRSTELALTDLPPTIGAKRDAVASFTGEIVPMREMQRQYASWAYEKLGAKKLVTAEKLDVDPKTLAKLLRADDDKPDD